MELLDKLDTTEVVETTEAPKASKAKIKKPKQVDETIVETAAKDDLVEEPTALPAIFTPHHVNILNCFSQLRKASRVFL